MHDEPAAYNPFSPDFWRNMSTLKVTVVTIVLALLVICACVGNALLTTQAGGTTPQTRATVTLGATSRPTRAVAPTATPRPAGPQPLSGATLGGTQDGFTHMLGTPTDRSGVPWYTVPLPGGAPAQLCYCTERPGTDGNPHLASFHIDAPSGATWSDQQGVTISRAFFPPDARHVRDFTDPQIGLIHVYISADLAATFPAGEFTDSGNGQHLPPGTFSVACGQPGPSQCILTTGD